MTPDGPIDEAIVQSTMSAIAPRFATVRRRVDEAAGEPDRIEILAVTKGHPIETVVAAQRLDLDTLGEDRAHELAAKVSALQAAHAAQPRWHFIGQLQTNKVRQVADHVLVWQSVDRLKLGREIAKRAPNATVFVQVNLSDDPNRGGCGLNEVDTLVEGLDALGLNVDGLMGVGTAGSDERTAAGFGQLRSAVDRLSLRHCSMGMSADLELAVEHGSTMVRIGSDIFGPRS